MKFLYKASLSLCLLASTTVWADPTIRTNEVNYAVNGLTQQDLREDINNKRPDDGGERNDSATHWNVAWHFEFRHAEGQCYVMNKELTIDVITVLPKWNDYDSATPEMRAKWDQYLETLRAHEDGHTKNAESTAFEIGAMLDGMYAKPSCEDLEKDANNAAEAIVKEHRHSDLALDEDTHHGRSQDAVFP